MLERDVRKVDVGEGLAQRCRVPSRSPENARGYRGAIADGWMVADR